MQNNDVGIVRVGPAGWSYDDWKGIVYPSPMPKSLHPLTFLSSFFDTVEINSTFYHPPNRKHCSAWVRHVAGNPRFKFTVKLWERFTHKREAEPRSEEVRMFTEGIIQETRTFLERGIPPDAPPFKALGYKQVVLYLQGKITLEDAVERTKIETRHYAKRQMTWFRKMEGIRWFSPSELEEISEHISSGLD